MSTTFYCDGACIPVNPGGHACWAWIALEDGREIARDHGCIGRGAGMTNNVAEYHAVIRALKHAQAQGWTGVRIRADSQLIVRQITGQYACNAPTLINLRAEASALGKALQARIAWIPREQNEEADKLTRQAYRESMLLAEIW